MRPLLFLLPPALVAISACWYVESSDLPAAPETTTPIRAGKSEASVSRPGAPAAGARELPPGRAESAARFSRLPDRMREEPVRFAPRPPIIFAGATVFAPEAEAAERPAELNGRSLSTQPAGPRSNPRGAGAFPETEPLVPAPLPAGIIGPAPELPHDELRSQRVKQLRQEFIEAAGDPAEVTPDGRDYTERYLDALSNFDQQFIALYGYSAYSQQQAWVVRHGGQ